MNVRLLLHHAHPSRRGTAIIPALLVVLLTATLSMIYLQVSMAKNKEQRSSVDAKRAFYMAEAGLAEAFNGLCMGKSGDVGTEDLPAEFANGLFYVTAKDEGQGRTTLKSTGMCGAGRATLSIVVARQPDEIASRGFFADQGVTVEPGAYIDSYDSRNGNYQRPSLAAILGGLTGAHVGCNGDVTVPGSLLANTYILGDTNPGQSGTLFRTLGTTITGSTAPAASNATLPPIVVPTYTSQGDVHATNGGATIEQGEQGFGQIRVDTKGDLTINGPAIITADSLVVAGRINFDARKGPIKLYLRQGIRMLPGSEVRTAQTDPLNLSIAIPGSGSVDLDGDGVVDPAVTLAATGSFFGTIYAPNAPVTLQSSMEIFGAVSAQSLDVQGGTKLHYDRALSESSSDTSGPPRFLTWRIVELPQVPLVSLRFDALKELKKEGKNPKLAHDAHFKIGELLHDD
jgi:hypothetical protein